MFAFQQLFYEYLNKQKNFNINKASDDKDLKKSKKIFVNFIQEFYGKKILEQLLFVFKYTIRRIYNLDYFS